MDDFKISHAVGVDFETTLRKVEEDGEYTYAYASERGEQVQLATYDRIYPITRQAIINDDLGVFTDRPPPGAGPRPTRSTTWPTAPCWATRS